MKTLQKQIEDNLNKPFLGHPSRQSEHDIGQIKLAILRLAQAIDTINEFAKFE